MCEQRRHRIADLPEPVPTCAVEHEPVRERVQPSRLADGDATRPLRVDGARGRVAAVIRPCTGAG